MTAPGGRVITLLGGTGSKTIAFTDDIPTVSTTAEALKDNATTGEFKVTGITASQTRIKTVRDINDTILELGGSYTPTGT
jgi:hypothetical protein